MTADLAPLTTAERMLADIVTAEDARVAADVAGAAAVWAKKAGLGLSASNSAKAIEIKALMRLADLVDEGMSTGEIAHSRLGKSRDLPKLSDIGTTTVVVQRARIVRDHIKDPARVDELATELTHDQGELTVGRLVAMARKGPAETQDDWYTPRWLFQQLGLTFDIDVAAPADPAARNCPARAYYTEADDGLAQPWDGLVWCNPPYSDPAPWIHRWAAHRDGLLLTHFSVASRRMPELWASAHSIRLFAAMWFDRPDGGNEKPFWGLMLAARGRQAVAALANVDNEWASPHWCPTI